MRPGAFACILALLLLGAPLAHSQGADPLDLVVTSPTLGQFVGSTAVTVTGQVTGPQASIASLEVNGQSALPVAADGSWSLGVTLDPSEIFHEIRVDLTDLGGALDRELVTIILGDSIVDGELAESGSAMRLNDPGLQALAGTVTGDLDIDIGTLLPPGTMLTEDYCYFELLFCFGSISAQVSATPPPSIGGLGTSLDSRTGSAHADIALNDLFVNVDVYSTSGISITCELTITAPLLRLGADFTIQPQASDPSYVDVIQTGGVASAFVKLQNDAGCSGFLSGLVESFVEDAATDMIETEVTTLMDTVDAEGNTPIAAAFETALDGLELANEIGSGLELDVNALFNAAVIDDDGTTLDLDVAFLAITPDPNAVDLTESLDLPSTLPTFGASTPAGALYDLALGVGPAAFNNLLKAETEKGLLITSISELTVLGQVLPLTGGLVSLLAPELGVLPGALPLRLDIQPRLAPVVSGEAGPNGELAELQVAHMLVSLRSNDGSEDLHLSFVVDLAVGLNAGLNEAGQMSFSLGTLDPAVVGVGIIANPYGVNETDFVGVIQTFLPTLFPELAAALAAFPLPDLAGLTVSLVEASRNGDFLTIFLSVPKNVDQHAVLFDGSGVVVYDTGSGNFSGGHYVQDLPTSFETGTAAEDNQLGFFGNRKAVLNNGTTVSTYDFSAVVGFADRGVTQQFSELPAGFENGTTAEDNVMDFPISNLAVLYNGTGVTLHDFNGATFSGSRSIQGVPTGFEVGSTGKDNNLMFVDPSTAWLWDGINVKEYNFDPTTGFEFVSDVVPQPSGFETGDAAGDNQLGFTLSAPSDPSTGDTCTAVLYDGTVVRVYDFDHTTGFSNMRYVQGSPPVFEWEGATSQDNHLAFLFETRAIYVDSNAVHLYDFNVQSGFTYLGESQSAGEMPAGFDTGEDGADDMLDLINPYQAILFNGLNVIQYDFLFGKFSNPQVIQGVPEGFEVGVDAEDNQRAFANANQAVVFDGVNVKLYDFDTTNGFTNPQILQGVPEQFETGAGGQENVLSILPGCVQPEPPLCSGDESTGDTDGDGICDDIDPCPADATDDSDGDGSCDSVDLCTGDDTSGDTDSDGVCDDTDACPADANDDSDGDGSCDSNDLCTGNDTSGDTDSDGVCDDTDACPLDANDDSDGDGSCDSVDLCTGDDTSGDTDSDGACDDVDAFANDPTETTDTDSDGVGNNAEAFLGTDPADPDSDDDGYTDQEELIAWSDPLDSESTPATGSVPSLGPLGTGLLGLFLASLGSRRILRRQRRAASS
ncbi:MAG: hypothetical protein VX574_06460 [Myxococcota bacterium]|nr:hypothetical protein [Myxococcota bacterium]